MLDDVILLKELTNEERLMFQSEFSMQKKDPTIGVLLCFFLGGIGVHRFYMGQTALGILYACFVWTLVPALVAFVECFLMSKRIQEHNGMVARSHPETCK